MGTSNYTIVDNCIYSYNTCIATWDDTGNAVMNNTKYSPTTSKHQTKARVYLSERGFRVVNVNNIEINTGRDKLKDAQFDHKYNGGKNCMCYSCWR